MNNERPSPGWAPAGRSGVRPYPSWCPPTNSLCSSKGRRHPGPRRPLRSADPQHHGDPRDRWRLGRGEHGRHPLPDRRSSGHLRRCGVDDDSSIVVPTSSLAAGRAWWILRWAGLTDVRVLDGGLAAWTPPASPLRRVAPARRRIGGPAGLGALRGEERSRCVPEAYPCWWRTSTGSGGRLDVRARYRGEVEPIDPVAGHIPGAVNLPMGLMQHGDGTFDHRTRSAVWRPEAGIGRSTVVATSCGSGVTTSPDGPGARDCGTRRRPTSGRGASGSPT